MSPYQLLEMESAVLGNHVHIVFIALTLRYVIVNCYFIFSFLPVTDSSVPVIYVGRGRTDLKHSTHSFQMFITVCFHKTQESYLGQPATS